MCQLSDKKRFDWSIGVSELVVFLNSGWTTWPKLHLNSFMHNSWSCLLLLVQIYLATACFIPCSTPSMELKSVLDNGSASFNHGVDFSRVYKMCGKMAKRHSHWYRDYRKWNGFITNNNNLHKPLIRSFYLALDIFNGWRLQYAWVGHSTTSKE